jgi:hypothetical protein
MSMRSHPSWWLCAAALLAMAAAGSGLSPTAGAQTSVPVQFSASVATLPVLHASRVSEVRRALLLAQEQHAADREQPVAEPRGMMLEWLEVPVPSSDVAKSTGQLTLRALNLDRAAYAIDATVVGDAGTMASRRRSAPVSFMLPEDALQEIRVDAAIPIGSAWSFSGAVAVHVRACPIGGSAAAKCLVAVSDPVFFHPTGVGSATRFYGQQALAVKYASGALRGAAPTPGTASGESTMTLRVMGGGPLSVDPATDVAVQEEQ